MKSNIILFILSALLFLGCQKNKCYTESDGFKSMKPNCFEKAIKNDNVTLVDVRKINEYVEGHIDGAINIDVLSNDFRNRALTILPKENVIAVYCRGGKRSKNAAQILISEGYDVIELDSGFIAWEKAGKPIVK